MANLAIPEYIHTILWEMGNIKGAALHDMIDAAIVKDGRVPSEEEWIQMVDAVTDELTDLDLQQVYPAVTDVLQDFFIP